MLWNIFSLNDHQREKVLILSTNSINNVWRSVGRICMHILGLIFNQLTAVFSEGKWMYEILLGSKGIMQLGWATLLCKFTNEVCGKSVFCPFSLLIIFHDAIIHA